MVWHVIACGSMAGATAPMQVTSVWWSTAPTGGLRSWLPNPESSCIMPRHRRLFPSPRIAGHIGLVVPSVADACKRFEELGVEFVKRPDEGKMR